MLKGEFCDKCKNYALCLGHEVLSSNSKGKRDTRDRKDDAGEETTCAYYIQYIFQIINK